MHSQHVILCRDSLSALWTALYVACTAQTSHLQVKNLVLSHRVPLSSPIEWYELHGHRFRNQH